MSPCQHGWHRDGGTGLSQHPLCHFACHSTQPTPSTAAIKLFIVTLMGWLLSGVGTGGCGDLGGQQGTGATISSPAVP